MHPFQAESVSLLMKGAIQMPAIILCGGLATRFGDTTEDLPKVLLYIAGNTVLEWQIQLGKRANVEAVLLASGH